MHTARIFLPCLRRIMSEALFPIASLLSKLTSPVSSLRGGAEETPLALVNEATLSPPTVSANRTTAAPRKTTKPINTNCLKVMIHDPANKSQNDAALIRPRRDQPLSLGYTGSGILRETIATIPKQNRAARITAAPTNGTREGNRTATSNTLVATSSTSRG